MDIDFWASRVYSAKPISVVQPSRLLNSDNPEGDDETGAFFPCPFCYIDIKVSVLCSHLHEEHCFDFKNAVCPLCAANLGKDAISHFTVQHSHLIKRQKSKKNGNESRDLSSLAGPITRNDRVNENESVVDSLISPFLRSISSLTPSNLKDNNIDRDSSHGDSETYDPQRTKESSAQNGDDEQDLEEKRRKSEFVRQLIFSAIF